jgi:hypothetical protein
VIGRALVKYGEWAELEIRFLHRFLGPGSCYKKLFLCRPVDHRSYLDLCQRFVADHPELDYCAQTLARKRVNDDLGFVPRFFGFEILPFP